MDTGSVYVYFKPDQHRISQKSAVRRKKTAQSLSRAKAWDIGSDDEIFCRGEYTEMWHGGG